MAQLQRRRRLWRRSARVVLLIALLAAGAWLGLRGREALVSRGCLPLPADVIHSELPLADPTRVRFAALGDTGTGKPLQRQIAETLRRTCAERGCDFVLLLGDNVYPSGVRSPADPAFDERVERVYGPLQVPVYAVLGNHDVDGDALAQVYRSLGSAVWRMPNTQYSFRAGPVQVFALNTNCGLLAYSGLYSHTHATPQQQPDAAAWTLAMGHHTLHTSGAKAGERLLQRRLWDTFLAHHVDLYLSGHEHLLAHLSDSATASAGERTDYLISGGGGEAYPAQNARPDAERAAPLQQPFVQTTGGFMWFEISADAARWVFYNPQGMVTYAHERKR